MYTNVTVFDHPLITHKISVLRSVETSCKEFRELIEEIATMMGYETLRDLPLEEVDITTPICATKAKILASYFGGVPSNILFDFERKDGWTRIGIGGTAGYMMNEFLEEMEFDIPAWRPPLAALKKQTVSVYAKSTGNDPLTGAETLAAGDAFCVLGRGKTRHHIRINTEEPGQYFYGWIDEKDLKSTDLTGGLTTGKLLQDTQVLNWDGEVCRVLRAGTEVRYRWFYNVFPGDGGAVDSDYCDPAKSTWVWVDATVPADPDAEWDPENPEFIEEWGIGFIPVYAAQIDRNLMRPE